MFNPEYDGHIQAAEIEHDGITYRSWLEWSCASLLRMLRLPHEYEPCTFQLGERLRYTPDFWIAVTSTFFEPRGHVDAIGEAQIEVFSTIVEVGAIGPDFRFREPAVMLRRPDGLYEMEPAYTDTPDYVILRPEGPARLVEFGGITSDCYIAKCRRCRHFFMLGERGSTRCRACGADDGWHLNGLWAFGYDSEEQELSVGRRPLRKWIQDWHRAGHPPER